MSASESWDLYRSHGCRETMVASCMTKEAAKAAARLIGIGDPTGSVLMNIRGPDGYHMRLFKLSPMPRKP